MSVILRAMPTHLFCLLDARSDHAPSDDLPDVRLLIVGSIAAWVATTPREKVDRDAKRAAREVVEHDAVISRAVERGLSPVPAALGDPYGSDDAVIADVAARSAEIEELLRRTAGSVEMTIVLAGTKTSSQATMPSTTPGRAYLERLRSLPARLEQAADALDARVHSFALAATRRSYPDRVGLSHLIRGRDVAAYRRAVGDAGGGVRLAVDGPRAAYSFAAFGSRLPHDMRPWQSGHETGRLDRDPK